MSFLSKATTFGFLAALAIGAAVTSAAPAAAQPWGGPGWNRPHHRHWAPPPRRCWVEERRMRVMTPWGPRWERRMVRVCR